MYLYALNTHFISEELRAIVNLAIDAKLNNLKVMPQPNTVQNKLPVCYFHH